MMTMNGVALLRIGLRILRENRNNMKKKILLFAFLYFSNFTFSQNQFSEKIKHDCLDMVEAMKNKNYNVILAYTYPKIIEMGGGKEKLLDLMKKSFDQMEKEGFTFENQIIKSPGKIFSAGNELHCIVPKETIMNSPRGKFKATYYLLAISKDKGKKWYFLETHKFNDQNLKLILPNFNKELIIPKNTKPVLLD
jgi:hypothetical protein